MRIGWLLFFTPVSQLCLVAIIMSIFLPPYNRLNWMIIWSSSITTNQYKVLRKNHSTCRTGVDMLVNRRSNTKIIKTGFGLYVIKTQVLLESKISVFVQLVSRVKHVALWCFSVYGLSLDSRKQRTNISRWLCSLNHECESSPLHLKLIVQLFLQTLKILIFKWNA